jgi:hypothetical protein
LDFEYEHWQLLQSGVVAVAACKLLGIGRKTGYRWRADNGGLPGIDRVNVVGTGLGVSCVARVR